MLESSASVIRSTLIQIQTLLPASSGIWASYLTSLDAVFLICKKGRLSLWKLFGIGADIRLCKSSITIMPLPLVTACSGHCVLAIESPVVCGPPALNKKRKTKKELPVLAWRCEVGQACALVPEYLCSLSGKFPRLNRLYPAPLAWCKCPS